MKERFSPAPQPTYRLVPSQFPPVALFDTVATAADLLAVMDLEGWTNDRLVAERIARLPQDQWVYGRPNASIVMAAFLHAAPGGMRFNGPELGAWYAAPDLTTSVVEVAHHLRRELLARGRATMKRRYRSYRATLEGSFFDIRGEQVQWRAEYDSANYAASQVLGERLRADDCEGLLYDSIRHAGGTCVVAYKPQNVLDVVQADHYEITVSATSRAIDVRKL